MTRFTDKISVNPLPRGMGMRPSEGGGGGGGDGGGWGAAGLDSPVGSVESDGMEAVWSSEEEERARAEGAAGKDAGRDARGGGTQFSCFTGTKVHILT